MLRNDDEHRPSENHTGHRGQIAPPAPSDGLDRLRPAPSDGLDRLRPASSDASSPGPFGAVDDEIDELELDTRPPTPRTKLLGRASFALLAGIIGLGGFAAGAYVKHPASTNAATTASPFAGGRQGGATAGFSGGGRTATTTAPTTGAAADTAAAAGPLSGQVKLVDGANIYVQDAEGNVVKVHTSPTTGFSTQSPAALDAITAGQTVTVIGTAGADGTVAATAVAATPAAP